MPNCPLTHAITNIIQINQKNHVILVIVVISTETELKHVTLAIMIILIEVDNRAEN